MKDPARGERLLLIDASSGIAGDMFLAALADLGFDLGELADAFARAGIPVKLAAEEVLSGSLRGLRLKIEAPEDQPHRDLVECRRIVGKLALPVPAESMALEFLDILAAVEGRLHGVDPERVHFHEVGALDSLVDLAGAALGIHRLEIGGVRLRDLVVGSGTVRAAHGTLPLPAPATLELLKGFPVRECPGTGEMVTPTGAAILARCAEPLEPGFGWSPEAVGYGAGTREIPGRPNLLRLTLARPSGAAPGGMSLDSITVLRCALDDESPEALGGLMERLLDAGALDVGFTPRQMKKNRPGLQLELLCREEDASPLARILFLESTALGLRIRREERWILPRRIRRVDTPFGPVRMKVAALPGGGAKASPEYEDCARLAREAGLSLADVADAARAAWREGEKES